jgi:TP901 family phage tail tape measure protein
MAEAIIKYSSLIEDDGGFLKLEKDLEALGKNLTAQVSTWKKSLNVVDVTDTEQIKKLELEIQNLRKSYDLLAKQKEKVVIQRKKISELTKGELIELEKERKLQSQNRAEAKAIAQVKSSQAGSIEQLRAKLALVTIAWRKLSEEERNNSERGKRYVQSKLDINEQLKREEKATGDARRNVGNYIEAVREAIAEMQKEKVILTEKNYALKNEQKNLEESSAEYKYYQKEIEKTEKDLKSLNDRLNEGEKTQEKFSRSTDTSTGFLKKMAIAIGGLSVLRTGAEVLADFDKNLADLKAVTGLTGQGLDDLKDKSIEFSKRFGTSASSILEAFKLAGSARPELLKNSQAMADLTEKAIILSKASGDDVPTSIKNLTGTLSAFDLPASKASEVMDTLANASQLGAQEIPYLTEAFTKFGAIASTAGVGVSESAAAVEILGQKIPDAATAGTNMKNILIKLQLEASKQGRSFQGLSKELLLMKPKLKDVTYLSKIFGSENLNGAQILIQNAERVKELSTQYGKQGTAMSMAETNMKSLGEAYNRMVSSVQAYFLESADGVNITQKLSSILSFLGDNIGSIVSIVGKLLTSFIVYHTFLKGKVIYDMVKASGGAKDFAKSLFSLNESTKEATESQKSMSNTLRGIGWTVAIPLAYELGKALIDVAFGFKEAREKQALFNKEKDKGGKKAEKFIETLTKETQEELRVLDLKYRTEKANTKNSEKLDKEYLDNKRRTFESESVLLNKLIEIEEKNITKKTNFKNKSIQLTNNITEAFNKGGIEGGRSARIYQDQLEEIANQLGITISYTDDYNDINRKIINTTEAKNKGSEIAIDKYKTQRTEISKTIEGLKVEKIELDANTDSTNSNTDSKKKNTTELSANNTSLEYRLSLLRKINDIENEINQTNFQTNIDNIQRQIDEEIDLRTKQAENYGTIETERLNQLLQQEKQLKEKQILEQRNYEIKTLEENYKEQGRILREDLKKKRDELLAQENLSVEERDKINNNYRIESGKINKVMKTEYDLMLKEKENVDLNYNNKRDELNRDYVDKAKGLDKELKDSQREFLDETKETEQLKNDEKLIILEQSIQDQEEIIDKATNRQKTKELEALRELLKLRYQLQRKAIEDEYAYKLSQVEKGSAEEKKLEQEKINKLLELDNAYKKGLEKNDKDIADSRKKTWDEFTSTFKKIVNEILDRVEQLYQKEVKLAEDKINKQEKQVDIQRERAVNGLQNSLAFEEKERAKAEANKIKAEKRLERAQKIKALYSSYQNYASSGDKNAISKTLRDFAVLEAFTASFGDGGIVSDKLPSNGVFQGESHKGNNKGIKILVEGNEGIFSTREMKNLGRRNFYALKELAGRGSIKDGFFKSKTESFIQAMPVAVGNSELTNEVIRMRKAFENFEGQKLDVVNYTKDLFKIVETTKRGNFVTKNTYEIKRPRL